MKTKYILVVCLAFLGFIQSCDKIDNPIKEGAVDWKGRKILIYDFTGHKCGNCPEAHITINNLIDLYGDAIVPIAIHSTGFATPNAAGSTKFYYDFRTDIGDYLGGRNESFGYYGELFLPMGVVNNLLPSSLSSHNLWPVEAAKYISSYPEYLIELGATFSQTDSIISCNVKTVTNIANNRKLSLTVFLLEDKIIQWQKFYSHTPDEIEDYEHNHVLRAGFNGPLGEEIKSNNDNTSINDEISKSYTLRAAPGWDIENCSVVAFVYDTDTKEVLQAEIIHLNE